MGECAGVSGIVAVNSQVSRLLGIGMASSEALHCMKSAAVVFNRSADVLYSGGGGGCQVSAGNGELGERRRVQDVGLHSELARLLDFI